MKSRLLRNTGVAVGAWIAFVPGVNVMVKDFGMPAALAGAVALAVVVGLSSLIDRASAKS